MDWKTPPTLKQFVDAFEPYVKYVGINNPEGYIGSHKLVGHIYVYCDDPDDDTEYEISGLELDQLGGCGCESGVTIKIRRVKND